MNTVSKLDRIDHIQGTNKGPGTRQVQGGTAASQERPEPSREEISSMVDSLNAYAGRVNEHVQFSYHEKLNRVIVRVVDNNTQEVKREIPPKDMVALMEQIQEHLGILFDESR